MSYRWSSIVPTSAGAASRIVIETGPSWRSGARPLQTVMRLLRLIASMKVSASARSCIRIFSIPVSSMNFRPAASPAYPWAFGVPPSSRNGISVG